MSHLLLIGGGHAHVAVLADWIKRGLPCSQATLLTPEPRLRYSGMVPGWIAGRYGRDEGTVDVAALAKRAGVELVLGKCISIDPVARKVLTDTGGMLDFDIASIDTGGVGRARQILGDDPRLLDVRPIGGLVDALVERQAQRIAVIGGGAGGCELAFALKNRTEQTTRVEVTFVVGEDGLLPDLSSAVQSKVAAELARQGITVIAENARIKTGELFAGSTSLEPVDLIVTAIGSGAPDWPRSAGLACDERGFIAVDRHQRSLSHPLIFAVGDVASRQDRKIPHSGVHAVFAGPILSANLRAAMIGKEPIRTYIPRWNNLYLISTGDGSAIASYGALAAQGRWVARLKHRIDKRWITKYVALANLAPSDM